MQKILSQLLLTLGVVFAGAVHAADVGLTLRVGDPNFYGQIDVGQRARPTLIYEQPLLIQRSRYQYEPIYLRVPPGHARYWPRYCSAYRACARPVYFVQDRWYRDTYRHRDHWRGRGGDWHGGHHHHRGRDD